MHNIIMIKSKCGLDMPQLDLLLLRNIMHDATIDDNSKHLVTERLCTHELAESWLFKIVMYSDIIVVYEIFIFILNANPFAILLYDLAQWGKAVLVEPRKLQQRQSRGTTQCWNMLLKHDRLRLSQWSEHVFFMFLKLSNYD